ncbi:MAG: hypothetical protein IK130_09840 [Oscillospiraceae bacterium]|nr:hypothetical protein [Oscillospiraceae bacterium]
MEQFSEIERLRNMLMQAQEQNTLQLRREALESLFCRCFAAIRAQKPLYLLFSELENGLEQTRDAAEQMLAVLPRSAFTGADGFTLKAITPDTAGFYPQEDLADGSKPTGETSLLAAYYAGRVLGEPAEEQADALLDAVQIPAPDMEPYETIFALYYYGQEPHITEEPQKFWQYWRIVATRRGEQIYGALNAILKHLPRPALLYLRQKQEEQKAAAAEKQAQKEREDTAEQGKALLREMESRAEEIRNCAEKLQEAAEDRSIEAEEAEGILQAAEQAFSDISDSRERLLALGEPAADSAEASAEIVKHAEEAVAKAGEALESLRYQPTVLEQAQTVLKKAAEQTAAMQEYNEKKADGIRETVKAQLALLAHESGTECDRLGRFAAHILSKLDAAKKAAQVQDASENPLQVAPYPTLTSASVPMSAHISAPASVHLPFAGIVQHQQNAQTVPREKAPAPAAARQPETPPVGNTAQKRAEEAVNHAVVRYREMQNMCKQANSADAQFTAILRSMRSEPNAAGSAAYRDRAKILMDQTVTAWNKTAASAEEAAAVCRDALKYPHPEQMKNQLQTMGMEAQKLASQAQQRVRQISVAQASNTPENKTAGLMANANAAYQACHQLYLKTVQGALMTAHRAEKDAQADSTPASAMAQLLIVQRAAGQVAQVPELLRGYEERIFSYTDAAMQISPQIARDVDTLRRSAQNDRKNTENVISTLAEITHRLTEMAQMTGSIPSLSNAVVPDLPPQRDEMCMLLSQMLPMIAEANKKAMERAGEDLTGKRKLPAYPDLAGLEDGTIFGHRYQKNSRSTQEININSSFWEKYPKRFLSDSELGTKPFESAAYAKYCGTLNFVKMSLMQWTWDVEAEALRVNTGEAAGAIFARTDISEAFYCMLWALAVFYQDDSALVTKFRALPLYHKYFSKNCAEAFFSGKQGADRCNMCIFLALFHVGCILQLNLLHPLIQMRAGFDDPSLQQAVQYCKGMRLGDVLDDVLYYGILQNGLDQKNYRLIRIWMLMDKLLQG